MNHLQQFLSYDSIRMFTDDTKCREDFSPLKTRERDFEKIGVFPSTVPYTVV